MSGGDQSAGTQRQAGGNAPMKRSAARLAAVQALYQMDFAGTDLTDVLEHFLDKPIREEGEDPLEDADPKLFKRVLKGVVAEQRDIDPLINAQLAEGWKLTRVDSTLRALLRAGVFELTGMKSTPARVVINEYVELAKAFFDGDEPRVVNGVLDRLAHKLRPDEF